MAPENLLEPDDQRLVGLATFERWSNYLLITTVAGLGWTVTGRAHFPDKYLLALTVWSLGLSAICGIFTLALVPHLAQQIRQGDTSIYMVPIHVTVMKFGLTVYLTQACRPQHIAFISGVAFYCIGTVGYGSVAVLALVVFGAIAIMSKPQGRWGNRAG